MRPVIVAIFFAAALIGAAVPAFAQGLLIPSDESLEALELRRHEVEFEIQDNGARTHVTQVFANHTGRDLEATFYFSIPEGAVTTDFALWMNGERIQGEVLQRDAARQIYEGIVRRMRDPGLLEYIDGELFQASIYPVPANGEQTVEIEYATVLGQQGTMRHYRYPVHAEGARAGQFVVSGTVAASHPISTLYAPHHDIEQIPGDGGAVRVSAEVSRATPEDFELFIGIAAEDLGFSLLTHNGDDGEDGYFMLTLASSPDLEELDVLPKQVTFVVDTSGSMAGQKMRQAQEMLRYCVENLGDDDTFQIVSFSSGVYAAFDEPVAVSRSTRNQATAFIDALRARGNTNISGALERALDDPASADRPHAIIFVTDGLPTEGDTDVEDILEIAHRGISDGDRRVFSFGVGYDVNTRLLDGIARQGRGQSGYVRPEEDMSDIVGEYYDRIGSPLLTQIDLDFGSIDVDDVYPSPLPDLYRGQPITIFGRYDADRSSAVVVRGRAGGERYTAEYGATFDQDNAVNTSFVANLWAHRRVDALLTEIEEAGGEPTRLVDEVVELATEWGIVTPYTSYLAVDPNERQQIPQPGRPMANRGFGGLDESDDADFGEVARRQTATRTGGPAPAEGEADRRPRRDAPNAPAAEPIAAGAGGRVADSAARPMGTTGRAAVEESIARNENRERTVMSGEDDTGITRVGGRSFALTGGVWVQSDLGNRSVDRRITYLSDAYFELLREHPTLGEVLSLGERVRFRIDGEVIEITP